MRELRSGAAKRVNSNSNPPTVLFATVPGSILLPLTRKSRALAQGICGHRMSATQSKVLITVPVEHGATSCCNCRSLRGCAVSPFIDLNFFWELMFTESKILQQVQAPAKKRLRRRNHYESRPGVQTGKRRRTGFNIPKVGKLRAVSWTES